ncbi:MAG: methyltransferase domain-containing protein [Bacteroidetes bacterium]|nr:MAG: methyltransferase domain-containing protein [Bacteroidota bacterium]TAG88215.1 MAG: methyltransferase domain-containing protein [Bacteroidota bacterium]
MKKIISWVIRSVPRKYLQIISPFALQFLGFFYRGKDVECTVCHHQYKRFLPYGRGNSARNNALCPSCQALERHRLIWLYLKEKTDFFQVQKKVLHIAPESCFIHRFEKMKNLDYITADIESPLAKIKMDIHQIPFENNTFDVAFCNHVMEHVADDIKAMSEIYRVLKPSGWAIIQVPFFDLNLQTTLEDKSITTPKERFEKYGQEDHVRMYGQDYGRRLEKAGFEVIEDTFVKALSTEKIKKFGLPAEEIIYFCKK